jgi:hypothetical protein
MSKALFFKKKPATCRSLVAVLHLCGVCCFLFFFEKKLTAQGRLEHYDQHLAWLGGQALLDSFEYYTHLKFRAAYAADSLAVGLWAWVDAADLRSDQPAAALRVADQALAQAWRTPRDAYESEPLLYLHTTRGWQLAQLGLVWQSAQAYEQARTLYERWQFADFEAVEQIYKPLGNHYTRLGDNEKALAIFQKALAMPLENEQLAGLYNNIGLAQWNHGAYPQAIAEYRSGLALEGISAARRGLLRGGLALALLDAGQPAEAAQSAHAALRDLPATDARTRARIGRTAALAELRLGHLAAAEALLRTARQQALAAQTTRPHRDLAKIEIVRAQLFLQKKQPDAALDAAQAALRAVLPQFDATDAMTHPDAQFFYEENSIGEALVAKSQAAEMRYAATSDARWLRLALDGYQLAQQAEQRLRSVYAFQSAKLGLQAAAHARTEAALDVAHRLWAATQQPEYLRVGLDLAEASKSAILLDALHEHLIRQRLAPEDPNFEKIAGLRLELAELIHRQSAAPDDAALRLRVADLTDQLAQLDRQLRATYPTLDPVWADSSSRWLPRGTVVEYFVGASEVHIFWLKNGQLGGWLRQRLTPQRRADAAQFEAFFATPQAMFDDPMGYLRVAHALHAWLLPPECADAPDLLVVPDAWLCNLPFEALVAVAPTPHTTLTNAHYLLENQSISYAWSLAALARQHQLGSGSAPRSLVGVAPIFEGQPRGLAHLPATRHEWQRASAWQPTELIGAAATRSELARVAPDARVLHLATHAHAYRDSAVLPCIELIDGAVSLPDIYAWLLRADLVVLSACETGVGRDQRGEGVMSLARAFAQSGAACLVSSLWSVNDRSTALIFEDFYAQLSAGGSVAESLTHAKRAYLRHPRVLPTRQSPYFWAGLVAVGDAERHLPVPTRWPVGWWLLGGALLLGAGWFFFRKRKK